MADIIAEYDQGLTSISPSSVFEVRTSDVAMSTVARSEYVFVLIESANFETNLTSQSWNLRLPNETTRAAISEAERPETLDVYTSADDLFLELDQND